MFFKLGKTVVRITGEHPVVDLIIDELNKNRVERPLSPGPSIEFFLSEKRLPDMSTEVRVVGPVFALPDRAWIHFDNVGYRVFILGWEEGSIKVQVQILPRRKQRFIPLWAYRWRNWTFMSPLEQQAYKFINGILEDILLLFGNNTGLLHASAIEQNGNAVLFPSTGGVGKTTLSLLLVSQYHFNYISDDISLVSDDGFVFFYPRKIMMYPYSFQGYENLEKWFLSKRSFGDRLHWFWRKQFYGLKGGRRRVKARELYNNKVSQQGKIKDVYFLVRYPADFFKIEKVQPRTVASISSQIILAEYSYYINYLRYWEATGCAPLTVEFVRKRLYKIYEAAFRRSNNYILYIPADAPPQILVNYVATHFS